MFSTYLFDLDGTLIDSLADLATAVNLLRAEEGLGPIDLTTVRGYVGDGATMLVKRALPPGAFSSEKLQRFLAHYEQHLLEHTVPYPGIVDFLHALSGKNLAVVTNKPLYLTRRVLEGLSLTGLFRSVVGGDSCADKKPHPAPVQKALQELGAGCDTAIMIGDHHTDLLAGQAAGLKTCFCAWGLGHDGGVPFDYRAETPLELARLFPA